MLHLHHEYKLGSDWPLYHIEDISLCVFLTKFDRDSTATSYCGENGLMFLTWFSFNSSMESNHIPSKVWDAITYPFLYWVCAYLSMLILKLNTSLKGAPCDKPLLSAKFGVSGITKISIMHAYTLKLLGLYSFNSYQASKFSYSPHTLWL